MTVAPLNPFRPTRWEQQRDGYQLIWYTKTADQLISEKSAYIKGSRGSGKTTLLKSICWEDLSSNKSLRLQRQLIDFDHIGIYVRFPDHISASISSLQWSKIYPNSSNSEYEFHKFFSLVIEMTCAERALMACHELRLLGQVKIGPGLELSVVDQILSEFPTLKKIDHDAPVTFLDLARCFRNVVRIMNEASGRGTVFAVSDKLPPREPGELLSYVTMHLSNSVKIADTVFRQGFNPRFKFCLDDCEVLSLQQQISLNTLVRVAKQPVSWVVSFVGTSFEITETHLPQQPLTDADRRIISLDMRSDLEFRDLCQAVVSLRLYFSVSEAAQDRNAPSEVGNFFPLDIRLGKRSVNEIMGVIAHRSSSPMAQDLIRAAQNLKIALSKRTKRLKNRFELRGESLPLYETYVLLLWRGKEEAFKTKFLDEDIENISHRARDFGKPAFEAWLRRKQRAALLHFAASLGFRRLPLSGSDISLSLADRTVRDFLEVLGEIYESYSEKHKIDPANTFSLDKFVLSGSVIAADIQSDGIYNASVAYFKGVSARAEREVDILVKLIEGLGHYTSILQSDPNDPTTLGRSERGIFMLKFLTDPANHEAPLDQALWSTIKRAEVAGYLRPVDLRVSKIEEFAATKDVKGRVFSFRLHRRFSPLFRFSYRGAYEVVTLSSRDLWSLCDRSSAVTPRSWAVAMGRRTFIDDPAQLPLPLLPEADNE